MHTLHLKQFNFFFNKKRKKIITSLSIIRNLSNQARLNQPAPSLYHVAQLARERVAEFQSCQPSVPAVLITHRFWPQRSWLPPPVDLFKINFDGAVFQSENKTGIGVVVRNCLGLVLASCSQLLPQTNCAREIEALAAGKALSFAEDIGVTWAVLEGDSMVIIKALLFTLKKKKKTVRVAQCVCYTSEKPSTHEFV